MTLTAAQIEQRRRHNAVCRAYGCRREMAWEIEKGKSAFAKAARHFGPMFCWYVKDRYQWTLFGEDKSKRQIVKAAGIRRGRYNVAILPQ